MADSTLVLVWVWPHPLAVTCIVIVTFAAVLDPKIWLSHRRDGVYKTLNSHESIKH